MALSCLLREQHTDSFYTSASPAQVLHIEIENVIIWIYLPSTPEFIHT